MSKDFEKAYRELAEIEIPDLWGRIEAGLENRSTPEKTPVEKSPASKGRRKRKGISFNRYAGLAAAVLCVAVVIPAAVLLFRTGGRKGLSGGGMTEEINMAMDTSAPENAVMESASEESCEAAEEELDETAVVTEGGMDAGGSISGDRPDSADTGGMEFDRTEAAGNTEGLQSSAQSDAGEQSEDEAVNELADTIRDTGENASMKKENQSAASGSREPVEGTVFEHVVVSVDKVETDYSPREDGRTPGSLYTVTVQKAESGQLEEGEQLMIEIPVHSSLVLLDAEGVFEVDLLYKGNGIYGLNGYHQKLEE